MIDVLKLCAVLPATISLIEGIALNLGNSLQQRSPIGENRLFSNRLNGSCHLGNGPCVISTELLRRFETRVASWLRASSARYLRDADLHHVVTEGGRLPA